MSLSASFLRSQSIGKELWKEAQPLFFVEVPALPIYSCTLCLSVFIRILLQLLPIINVYRIPKRKQRLLGAIPEVGASKCAGQVPINPASKTLPVHNPRVVSLTESWDTTHTNYFVREGNAFTSPSPWSPVKYNTGCRYGFRPLPVFGRLPAIRKSDKPVLLGMGLNPTRHTLVYVLLVSHDSCVARRG